MESLENKTGCYHCNLPFKGTILNKNILGQEKKFCCLGCYVAFQLLNDSETKIDTLIEKEISLDFKEKNSFNENEKESFQIEGITCSSCIPVIEKILSSEPGVVKVKVNMVSEKARISFDNNYFDFEKSNSRLKKFGYSLKIPSKKQNDEKDFGNYILRLGLSWLLSMNIMTLSMARYFGELDKFPDVVYWTTRIEALFCSFIIFFIAFPILRGAVSKGIKFEFGMEALVSFGTLTSYFYSIWSLFEGKNDIYFDTSSMIVSLVLLGKFLENSSKLKAVRTIRKLLSPENDTILVLKNGQEEIVDIDDVKKDDLVILKPGEKIPFDGLIHEGSSNIDESMLTGESIPIFKNNNDKVFSGTINQDGYLIIKVTETGDETTIAKIAEMIEKAHEEKPESQLLADKVSAFFIPVVILITLFTAFGWYISGAPSSIIMLNTVSVLVVACPCALGLATPMTTFVALDIMAGKGIIFKQAKFLEEISRINTVIFDKTGTLTEGKMSLKKLEIFNTDLSENQILQYIGTLSNYSGHPVSKSLSEELKKSGVSFLKVENFQEIKGAGIEGLINGKNIRLGNKLLIPSATKYIVETNFEPDKIPVMVFFFNR